MSTTTNDSAESTVRALPVISGIEVGMIGVGANRGQPSAAWTAMAHYAELISTRTRVRTVRLPLPYRDARTVVSLIADLPWPVSAVFVVGLGPSESATVQRRVADRGGPLVITELDLVTVALAAAAMGTLRRNGVAPRQGRIVVVEAERAPRLGPILLAASGVSVTSWRERDAAAYPLCGVMSRNDVLVDLTGTLPTSVARGRIVAAPATPFDYGALVLPGLLSAICGHREPMVTLDMLVSCAQALALLTPTDDVLPDLNQRLLIRAVARHVARTLINRPQARPSRLPAPSYRQPSPGETS